MPTGDMKSSQKCMSGLYRYTSTISDWSTTGKQPDIQIVPFIKENFQVKLI